MSPRAKREYLAAIVKRYRAAPRPIKTAILTEFCTAYGYHRKTGTNLCLAEGFLFDLLPRRICNDVRVLLKFLNRQKMGVPTCRRHG